MQKTLMYLYTSLNQLHIYCGGWKMKVRPNDLVLCFTCICSLMIIYNFKIDLGLFKIILVLLTVGVLIDNIVCGYIKLIKWLRIRKCQNSKN
jgi:hypothetical protein